MCTGSTSNIEPPCAPNLIMCHSVARDKMVPVIRRVTVRARKEAKNVSHGLPSELFVEPASVVEATRMVET